MTGKRRRNELIWTGILGGIVVILAIILAVLVTGYRNLDVSQQAEMESETEVTPETMISTEKFSETELTETASEISIVLGVDDMDSTTGTEDTISESEQTTEDGTGVESESDAAAESGTEAEKLVVAIDPGHQGSWVDMSDTEPLGPGSSEMKAKASTGTQGTYSGLPEYELNLEISLLLRTELEARGYEVILTREDNDTAISNAERAIMAYEQGGDIYVRIHANGSEDSSVNGALGMVPSSSNPYVGYLAEDSYLLADCILSAYCSTAGFASLGVQYYDNMTGINWSQIPVMILEMGFMTNESDDLRMADASVQALMVQGIADGIDDYFTQKGMKTVSSGDTDTTDAGENTGAAADTSVTVSAEAEESMNTLIEQLGESYIYPSIDQGETWAVSMKSLNDGAEGEINGDVQMKSASVIKVFIMAAIYDRVLYPSTEEDKIELEESYEGELEDLITQMITVSDNTAANTLVTRLGDGDSQTGMSVVNQFLEENGYTGTSMGRLFLEENPSGDNYTTANDCRAILTSIYNGTCVNEEASSEMYDYLKQQTRTSKIPAGVTDSSAVVANKTGELAGDYNDYVENDIAIVMNQDQAYVLCILSGSLQSNSAAIEKITEISDLVYHSLITE
ncbi:MAG: serine hydrolase [Clostridiales bacterium]|nr:serine hydrolase [Clostridiales bacterium]